MGHKLNQASIGGRRWLWIQNTCMVWYQIQSNKTIRGQKLTRAAQTIIMWSTNGMRWSGFSWLQIRKSICRVPSKMVYFRLSSPKERSETFKHLTLDRLRGLGSVQKAREPARAISPEMHSFHHGHTVAGLHQERGSARARWRQEHREYADAEAVEMGRPHLPYGCLQVAKGHLLWWTEARPSKSRGTQEALQGPDEAAADHSEWEQLAADRALCRATTKAAAWQFE